MISFLIPTKNEPYLWDTIHSIEDNSYYKNEILWHEDTGLGQRGIINKLAKEAKHKIVCKVDAHCSFGPDFDKHLLEELEPKMVIAPTLYPLDKDTWALNHHNPMRQFAFDSKFIMHHVPGGAGETMCMQGSFFMCHKDFFFDANLCDDTLGSWGGQAVELGIQTWTNGGVCKTTDSTFYGHIFRHANEEFPYKRNQKDIDRTYATIVSKYKDLDLGWLIKKFDYPLDWTK